MPAHNSHGEAGQAGRAPPPRARMYRWSWVCPWLAMALAAALLALWGLSWWSVALATLLLVCPVLMLWGVFYLSRPPHCGVSLHTRGISMDWAAPFYDVYCSAAGLGHRFRARTLRVAAIRSGEKVLDVGCGTGVLTRLAREAAGDDGSALGIDPSAAMIGVAQKNARRFNSRAEFRIAAIERLPVCDAEFDVVLASLMLHHLPPDLKRRGLLEVRRALKPGGRLVVADFSRPSNPLWWFLVWPLLFVPATADNLRGRLPRYFAEAGFDHVRSHDRYGGIIAFWSAFKSPGERGAHA